MPIGMSKAAIVVIIGGVYDDVFVCIGEADTVPPARATGAEKASYGSRAVSMQVYRFPDLFLWF